MISRRSDGVVDDETAYALNELNLAFYREHADAFSAKRDRPWRGWSRLLEWIPERKLSVLDVGCGNARFGRFLALHRRLARYVGLDASEPLLSIARADPPCAEAVEWVVADFVGTPPGAALPRTASGFDLVVLFGVLHGVPGGSRRRALLEAAAARLARGGLLVFTSWCFADDPRLAGRIVAWDQAAQIDATRLESGDHLLPWGDGATTLRYGHVLGAGERDELTTGLALEERAEFLDDGPRNDSNHYALYARVV